MPNIFEESLFSENIYSNNRCTVNNDDFQFEKISHCEIIRYTEPKSLRMFSFYNTRIAWSFENSIYKIQMLKSLK